MPPKSKYSGAVPEPARPRPAVWEGSPSGSATPRESQEESGVAGGAATDEGGGAGGAPVVSNDIADRDGMRRFASTA